MPAFSGARVLCTGTRPICTGIGPAPARCAALPPATLRVGVAHHRSCVHHVTSRPRKTYGNAWHSATRMLSACLPGCRVCALRNCTLHQSGTQAAPQLALLPQSWRLLSQWGSPTAVRKVKPHPSNIQLYSLRGVRRKSIGSETPAQTLKLVLHASVTAATLSITTGQLFALGRSSMRLSWSGVDDRDSQRAHGHTYHMPQVQVTFKFLDATLGSLVRRDSDVLSDTLAATLRLGLDRRLGL